MGEVTVAEYLLQRLTTPRRQCDGWANTSGAKWPASQHLPDTGL